MAASVFTADPSTATGCLARLRGGQSSLSKAEQKVAAYVTANPERLLAQAISGVAAGSDVSEATVMRFCRTLGYSGFQEFKIALARDRLTPLQSLLEDVKASDDTATVVRKVFGLNIQTLQDTLDVLEPEAVARAVELLEGAARIFLIGVGTSGPGVTDAYNKFSRLGLPVRWQTDGHLQVMEAALLGRGDVVLAISHSGSTRDPIETIEVARGAGARVISITNNALSPITKVSDVVLVTASSETRYRAEALASRLAQAAIVDALFVLLGMRHARRTYSNQRKIEDAIVRKQY